MKTNQNYKITAFPAEHIRTDKVPHQINKGFQQLACVTVFPSLPLSFFQIEAYVKLHETVGSILYC
jgi:hypothetical protein